ncbi:MAG: hypothetical protein F4012_13490 [Gemmatimonadales bacterium]|nr:hypothetical protein [Gemmatimonadales bacterium]MYL07776.1 hypothetical protein [Gemmatimonadales bacterium]
MRSPRVRNMVCAATVATFAGGMTACELDNNPYGPAYRTVHHTIVGAYRPLELLRREVADLPDDFQPLPVGSDVRLVFGSIQNLSSRITLTGFGSGGTTLDTRLYGSWEYDVNARRITMKIDPSATIAGFETVLQVTLLDRWVRIQGVAEIGGRLVPLDLGKSLFDPIEGGGGGGPANRVSAR